ncbi:hypothetical protein [Bacillus timonensis]|uniref:hypothetical protein n=1 Tax=Bacillus timonensis TaxID=1033734 RepID=UPI000289B3E3|nr:hypothetical protein [Bacillus timonensis]
MFFASGKNKEAFEKLFQYGNQQVVLNWYEDELLIGRDGFFFTHLLIENGSLIFRKGNKEKQTILLVTYKSFEIVPDFRDFYQLTNETELLQIYFPH